MDFYLAFDGDKIGSIVGRATLEDNEAKVKETSSKIDSGNEIFKAWALQYGSVINIGGDEGRIKIHATRLSELAGKIEQYEEVVGATVSVGIGTTLSQAQKALIVAKLNGGDRIEIYSPEFEEKIEALKEKPENEKIGEEYVKSEPDLVEGMLGELDPNEESEYGMPEIQKEFENLTRPKDPEKLPFSVKTRVLSVLEYMKQNQEVFSLMKIKTPELYQSIVGLVSTMIELARNQKFEDEQIEKTMPHIKEKLPVGTVLDSGPEGDPKSSGKVKVLSEDGSEKWVSARAGLVMAPNGQPTSSKHPEGLKVRDEQGEA